MNAAVTLLPLVLVPIVVAFVATRLGRSKSFVIWSAVVAQLITIALTRAWARHAAARAMARAVAEHRNFAVLRFAPNFQRDLVVCIVLTSIAAVLALSVFTATRSTRA